MGYGYQRTDIEIVDYALYRLPGIDTPLRGPRQALPLKEHILCLGAAQTFGRFVQQPFPFLLGDKLGCQVVNFGFAGAGPSYFLNRPHLIDFANKSKLVILQVMSGRSEPNRIFEGDRGEQLRRRSDGSKVGATKGYSELIENQDSSYVNQIVDETRENWVNSYTRLLSSIDVPKILFWFSVRVPKYDYSTDSLRTLFGAFPQLVNESMIETLSPFSTQYIECVSSRGMPQRLLSKDTGKPVIITGITNQPKSINSYYPTPEMHVDAAEMLAPVCLAYVQC